jgi:hypothetical protein
MARKHGRLRVLAATILVGAAACMGGVDRVYDDGGTTDASLGDTGIQGADGSSGGSDDATQPAEAAVDGADVGAVDGGAPDSAPSDTGVVHDAAPEAEAGPTFLCNGQQVTSCATCPGGDTVDCVFCAAGGAHPMFCGPKMYCQNAAPPGASPCNCPGGNVAGCSAPFQVCSLIAGQTVCQTCGESGSGNHPCKGGGTCDEASGTCK